MGKGGGESQTTSVPWGPQADQLRDFFAQAGQRSQIPLEYFPGSTVAGRDRQSVLARQQTEGLGSSAYRQSGQQYIGQVLGGDFMKAGNPHLDDTFDALSSKVTETFNRNVMPGVNSRFAGAGRSGSSAHGLSAGAAQGQLADSLSEIGSKIYYGDYENRTRDRMQALALSPAIQGLEYQDIGQRRGQGMVEENYMQSLLNDSISRFNFNQTEPEARLDRFGNRVGGGANSFGATTQTGGGNSGALGAGILGLLGTIGGSFFGAPGVGGAIGSGLGSLFGGGSTQGPVVNPR